MFFIKINFCNIQNWWLQISYWQKKNCLSYKKNNYPIKPQYAIERLYEITKDIDMIDMECSPIGTEGNPFTGKLTGTNYKNNNKPKFLIANTTKGKGIKFLEKSIICIYRVIHYYKHWN